MKKVIILITVLAIFAGCDPYAKLARSKKIEDKLQAAYGYYEKRKYETASVLLEELYRVYRGQPKSEDILYKLAEAKYHTRELLLAAYYYMEYTQLFPGGKYYEEAAYKEAICYYDMSPSYDLDQSATYKALEKFQLYLLNFPTGKYKDKVEELIKELNDKLALKAYKHAKLYYDIEQYKAAYVTFKNISREFYDSPYIENIYYYWFLSAYKLAENSVEEKKIERYKEAMQIYLKFAVKFPNSKYLKKIQNIYDRINENVSKRMEKDSENGAS